MACPACISTSHVPRHSGRALGRMSTRAIILICVGYLAAVLPVNRFLQWSSRKNGAGTPVWQGPIMLLMTPGNLLLLLGLCFILVPFFILYPEKHLTVVDAHGTDAQRAALGEVRSRLGQKKLWRRMAERLGFTAEVGTSYRESLRLVEQMAPAQPRTSADAGSGSAPGSGGSGPAPLS